MGGRRRAGEWKVKTYPFRSRPRSALAASAAPPPPHHHRRCQLSRKCVRERHIRVLVVIPRVLSRSLGGVRPLAKFHVRKNICRRIPEPNNRGCGIRTNVVVVVVVFVSREKSSNMLSRLSITHTYIYIYTHTRAFAFP